MLEVGTDLILKEPGLLTIYKPVGCRGCRRGKSWEEEMVWVQCVMIGKFSWRYKGVVCII